jgi:hypothetical protein
MELRVSALYIALIAVTMTAVSSCTTDNESGTLPSVPFLTGASSSYLHTMSVSDSLGTAIDSRADSFTVRIISTNATFNGIAPLALLEMTKLGSTTPLQRVWYKTGSDTLTEIGYQFLNAGSMVGGMSRFPKMQSGPGIGALMTVPETVRRIMRMRIAADSARLRDDPRIVYLFPLTIGDQWVSFRSPFLQTRHVIGSEMVTVRGGTFFCVKIRSAVEGLFEYFDYVAADGLVLRTIAVMLEVTTETDPDGTGEFITMKERLELISTK